MTESLKVTDGKWKNSKKDKRGIPSNIQRIKAIGEQMVASGKYPTIDAALPPPPINSSQCRLQPGTSEVVTVR